MINLFFWRKKNTSTVSLEELALLERENEESRKHALPDGPINNTYGDGSSFNNISRIQSTTNQSGLGAIVERKAFEPRSGQPQADQEAL
jgi:hypothetical protein